MPAYDNVNGVLRPVSKIHDNIGGTLREVKTGYDNVGGVLRPYHPAGLALFLGCALPGGKYRVADFINGEFSNPREMPYHMWASSYYQTQVPVLPNRDDNAIFLLVDGSSRGVSGFTFNRDTRDIVMWKPDLYNISSGWQNPSAITQSLWCFQDHHFASPSYSLNGVHWKTVGEVWESKTLWSADYGGSLLNICQSGYTDDYFVTQRTFSTPARTPYYLYKWNPVTQTQTQIMQFMGWNTQTLNAVDRNFDGSIYRYLQSSRSDRYLYTFKATKVDVNSKSLSTVFTATIQGGGYQPNPASFLPGVVEYAYGSYNYGGSGSIPQSKIWYFDWDKGTASVIFSGSWEAYGLRTGSVWRDPETGVIYWAATGNRREADGTTIQVLKIIKLNKSNVSFYDLGPYPTMPVKDTDGVTRSASLNTFSNWSKDGKYLAVYYNYYDSGTYTLSQKEPYFKIIRRDDDEYTMLNPLDIGLPWTDVPTITPLFI